jgi:alpha-N-acetylglucosaminidase
MDRLLATRKDFLLGPWIADARGWGTNVTEKNLYERNARNLITLWGDKNSPLHEYSCRQWSGLLNDFYKVRWKKFFGVLKTSIVNQQDPDLKQFDKDISEWEWTWVNSNKSYPVLANGSSVDVTRLLYEKYKKAIAEDLK